MKMMGSILQHTAEPERSCQANQWIKFWNVNWYFISFPCSGSASAHYISMGAHIWTIWTLHFSFNFHQYGTRRSPRWDAFFCRNDFEFCTFGFIIPFGLFNSTFQVKMQIEYSYTYQISPGLLKKKWFTDWNFLLTQRLLYRISRSHYRLQFLLIFIKISTTF